MLCASLLCSGCLYEMNAPESEGLVQSNESALASGAIEASSAITPKDFRIGVRSLVRAVGFPLSGSPLSPNVAGDLLYMTDIFITSAGRNSLKLALNCALAEGDFLIGGTPKENYMGGGLLLSTQNWRTSALSDASAGELFACMAAQINMNGTPRSMLLSGPKMNTKSYEKNLFDFEEAIFIAVPEPGAIAPRIHVWPKNDLSNLCGQETEISLRMRLCESGGTNESTCSVVVHNANTIGSDCTGAGNQLTCLGRAAITTTLQSRDLGVFHPLCVQSLEGAE